MIRMSDSNKIISMLSNRLNVNKYIIIENVRFQHFCQKMWALKNWCVTKVAHCSSLFCSLGGRGSYLVISH